MKIVTQLNVYIFQRFLKKINMQQFIHFSHEKRACQRSRDQFFPTFFVAYFPKFELPITFTFTDSNYK